MNQCSQQITANSARSVEDGCNPGGMSSELRAGRVLRRPRRTQPVPARGSGGRSSTGRQVVLKLVLDLAAPAGLYYGLRSAGVGVNLALLAGATAPGLSTVAEMLTRRRSDRLGVAVMATMVLTAGISLITGSPRFLLAREGLLTAAWAGWFFVSLRSKRPLTYQFSRRILEGRDMFVPKTMRRAAPAGGPRETWEALWERLPQFRRIWRVSTVIWGAAMLIDALARVFMAYALPISLVPALASALWPVTFIAVQVITNVYFFRSGLWLILTGAPGQHPQSGIRAPGRQDSSFRGPQPNDKNSAMRRGTSNAYHHYNYNRHHPQTWGIT